MKVDPFCQRQNCSPLNVLFSGAQIILISEGASNKGVVVKKRCVNISKTIEDMSKVTIND